MKTNADSIYDFIVVGAGSSGSVIATRLSENPNHKVLLIEAGDVPTLLFNPIEYTLMQIPLLCAYLWPTKYNWGYRAQSSDQFCQGMEDRRCVCPHGKGLGGSSMINAAIYSRGHPWDFNNWEALGNSGWSYNDVLKYFKKTENCFLGDTCDSYHGTDGPFPTEFAGFKTIFSQSFEQCLVDSSYSKIDYNGPSHLGTSYLQMNTQSGKRITAFEAFVKPRLSRSNLHVVKEAEVLKIIINPSTKIATGILYRNYILSIFPIIRQVSARKEIIISAGVFNSPKLLMLSGVGPEDHLMELGIPVIKNLPVGQCLHDHVELFGPTFVTNTTGNSVDLLAPRNLIYAGQYVFNDVDKSPLCFAGGVESLWFFKTPNSPVPDDVGDIEIMFAPAAFSSDYYTGIGNSMGVNLTLYNAVYKELEGKDVVTPLVVHFNQRSKGYLKLKSNNPSDDPLIYPNFFDDPLDMDDMVFAIKKVIEMVENCPQFQKYNTKLHTKKFPNCQSGFGTDEYWKCVLRTIASTPHHQVCTCKMGNSTDESAVVTPELKVIGISHLRVADTSIIPLPTTGHTAIPAMMIGEKVSDMIKDDWP